jgi:hypothetical protein
MHHILNYLIVLAGNSSITYDTPLLGMVDFNDYQRAIETHFKVSLEPYGFTPNTTISDIAHLLAGQVVSHP